MLLLIVLLPTDTRNNYNSFQEFAIKLFIMPSCYAQRKRKSEGAGGGGESDCHFLIRLDCVLGGICPHHTPKTLRVSFLPPQGKECWVSPCYRNSATKSRSER